MSNEPTTRRVIIGALPPAGGDVVFVGEEDPVRRAMRQAEAELDRQREERERAAAQTIVVNREFFNQVVHELDRALEAERRSHAGRRNYDRARNVAGKIRYLRERVAELNAR